MTSSHHCRHHRDRAAADEDPRCDACGKRHSRSSLPPGRTLGGGGAVVVVDWAYPARRRGVVASVAAALLLMATAGGASPVLGGAVAAPIPDAVVVVERNDRWAGGGGLGTTTTGRRLQEVDAAANETAAEEEDHEGEVHEGEEDHEGEVQEGEEHAGEDEHEGEVQEGEEHEGEEQHEGEEEHEGEDHAGEEEASASQTRPWGAVIGATMLVNVATLSGLLLVMCGAIRRGSLSGKSSLFDVLIYSFAAGALLATAAFLVLPEAMELIKGGHDEGGAHAEEEEGHRRLLRSLQEEHEEEHGGEEEGEGKSESVATAQFGCAFLGGFLLPLLLGILFHVDDDAVDGGPLLEERDDTVSATADTGVAVSLATAKTTKTTYKDEEEERPECAVSQTADIATAGPVYNRRLIASIIIGDSLHNFADGMFIAASFMGCDLSLAFTVVAMTLVHECAQEIGDFVLLTRHGGLSVLGALCLNFVSGMSVVLGGVVFLAAAPSDESAGVILAIAAGVYVNIATVETLPRIEAIVKTRMDRFWTLFGVILGMVPIGLVLLNHKHC